MIPILAQTATEAIETAANQIIEDIQAVIYLGVSVAIFGYIAVQIFQIFKHLAMGHEHADPEMTAELMSEYDDDGEFDVDDEYLEKVSHLGRNEGWDSGDQNETGHYYPIEPGDWGHDELECRSLDDMTYEERQDYLDSCDDPDGPIPF